jgi:hypothetical protein
VPDRAFDQAYTPFDDWRKVLERVEQHNDYLQVLRMLGSGSGGRVFSLRWLLRSVGNISRENVFRKGVATGKGGR